MRPSCLWEVVCTQGLPHPSYVVTKVLVEGVILPMRKVRKTNLIPY